MLRICCALAAACSLALASSAASAQGRPFLEDGDLLLRGYTFELGAGIDFGYSEFAPILADGPGVQPQAIGLVFRDKHGMTARAVAGMIVAIGAGMAASSPKRVETREYSSGGNRYRETTTYYRSPEEQRQIIENGNETIAGLFKIPLAEMELRVYGKDRLGYGDSTGHKVNFLYGGSSSGIAVMLGFGWGNVDSLVRKNNINYYVNHRYFGMPIRIAGGYQFIHWQLTFDWNWLGHGLKEEQAQPHEGMYQGQAVTEMEVAHHPVQLDFYGALFGQLHGGFGVTMADFQQPTKLGYRLYAGLRF